MLKKKLSKLTLSVEEEIFEEERGWLAELNDATYEMQQASAAFARALHRLNTVNAHLNRGPVEIEDELLHHCPPQETFNQRYADMNARYNAALDKKLAAIDANEQQK